MAYFLDEIRYEIKSVVMHRTRFSGITSKIKNFVSLNKFESKRLSNSGWSGGPVFNLTPHFNFSIPLKNLLGFAEDFKKVLLNCKQELVLLISKNFNDVVEQDKFENAQLVGKHHLNMTNITWKIPHKTLSDSTKIKMYDIKKSTNCIR